MSTPLQVAQPLQVALIGQRFMGRAHSNAWGQANRFFELPLEARLHTVAARSGAELADFARRWGWQHVLLDWRALAREIEIELVDIATPNHLHAEQSIAMLEAGKHVACEKPLACTLADARTMRDAARRAARESAKHAPRRTFVWFNYRRCPAVALAWQLVREGRLGAIRHVRAKYLQSWGGKSTPLSWRFQKKLAGSGAHGDLNAHIVDLARFLCGAEINEVHGAVARTFITERVLEAPRPRAPRTPAKRARKMSRRGKSDVDDALLFLASFDNGALASFEASRVATGHQNDNGIELDGERGALRFEFEDMNVLWYYDATLDARSAGWRRIMCTSSAGGHPYAANWWPDAHVLGYEHGFVNMAADILRALGAAPTPVPLPDFEDAYQTQRVLEAASIAARERCAVKLAQVR